MIGSQKASVDTMLHVAIKLAFNPSADDSSKYKASLQVDDSMVESSSEDDSLASPFPADPLWAGPTWGETCSTQCDTEGLYNVPLPVTK